MRAQLARAVVLAFGLTLLPVLTASNTFASPLTAADPVTVASPATVLVRYDGATPVTLRSSTANTLVPSPTGGIGTSYSSGYSLEPFPGQRLVQGRINLSKGQTGVPVVKFDADHCDTTSAVLEGGYLDVLDATYDASGVLTSFAANASLDCRTSVGTIQMRYLSTVPYADASAPPVGGSAYPGSNAAVPTTFTNTGTSVLTPGPTQLRGPFGGTEPAEPGSHVTDDGCVGTTLQPGQSCTVVVNAPSHGATALLTVPQIDSLAQRAVVPAVAARVGVLRVVPPRSVIAARATGAVDGVHVSWTIPESSRGGDFQLERRTGTGPWTLLAARTDKPFSHADTTAPSGQASSYRITPTTEAGPYPGGAFITAAATPVGGWSAPAGATTLGSVDGYAPASGSDVLVEAEAVTLVGTSRARPTMRIGMRGGWALGTWRLSEEFGGVTAGGSQNPDGDGGWGMKSGTLQVTRLVLRADGTPAELAAVLTGLRYGPDDSLVPVSAAIVVGTTGASMPGYLVAEAGPGLPAWASLDGGGALTILTANNMDFSVPVRLRNIGGASVTSTSRGAFSLYLTPPVESAWQASNGCQGVTIPAGQSCTTTVRFEKESGHSLAQVYWDYADRRAQMRFLSTWKSPWPTLAVTAPALVEQNATVQSSVTDPSGHDVQLHCRLDDQPFVDCGTAWHLTGLSDGAHRVSVYGYTADGRMSHWDHATITADSAPPSATLIHPAAQHSVVLAPTSPVAWTSHDHASGVQSSQLRVRTATAGSGYGGFAVPEWAQSAPAAGSATTAVRPGQEQCWSVRAVDGMARWSDWSPERCLTAPVDDRTLSARRFKRAGSAPAYNRTVSVAKRRGASLTLARAQARQVGLVVSTCSACGSANVLLGGKRVGTVNTKGSARAKVVVWLPRFSGVRTGSLTVVTTSRRQVSVDGVLFRHS